MRIAFIGPKFGEAFGQERAVYDSIKLLNEAGHETRTYGEPLASLDLLSSPRKVKNASLLLLEELKSFSPQIVHFVDQFDFRVMRLIAKNFPALLTAHTVAPTCPASHRLIYREQICNKKSGLSCLLYHHRFGCLKHFKNDLHRLNAIQSYLFKRRTLKLFRGIIAISRYVEDTLTGDGFDARRVFKIYNAVSLPEGRQFNGTPKKLIVTASRLVELKGVEYAIRALKLIEQEDWTFWILGEGPERKRLEGIVAELQLKERVFFKGQTSREDTEKIMRSALFITQTNVGPEGFGLSVAEAQAMGKPVIAFNVPALNEIVVHGETGYLSPPRDVPKLAEAFKTLLKDAALRLYFGSQAREHIAKVFSPENHLRKTIQVYQLCSKEWTSRKR